MWYSSYSFPLHKIVYSKTAVPVSCFDQQIITSWWHKQVIIDRNTRAKWSPKKLPLGPEQEDIKQPFITHHINSYLSRCILWSSVNVKDLFLLRENGNQSCLLTSPVLVTVNWRGQEVTVIMMVYMRHISTPYHMLRITRCYYCLQFHSRAGHWYKWLIVHLLRYIL